MVVCVNCKYRDGGDGREMGAKRWRLIEPGSSYHGTSPGASIMYNPTPYAYVAQPLPFPVVRVRGLPFDCEKLMLPQLDIIDVLFVHKGGKFTG